MPKTIFSQFTNQYSLTKTLRFELKPVGKTGEILETERKDRENFKRDRKIAENYQKLKSILNELHQEFIQDVMNGFGFEEEELKKFEEKYLKFLKEKDYAKRTKLKNAYEKFSEKLAAKIANKFKEYNQKKYGTEFTQKNLLGEKVFEILEKKYKNNQEALEIIRTFKYQPTQKEKKQGKEQINFTTYLRGFNENRKNFYKGELKAGQFATRTIDNLIQFIKNRKLFLDKYKDIYKEIGFQDDQIKIFELSYFNNLFLQDGLDVYNGIIAGKKGEKNTENDGLNQKINIFKQKEKTRCKNSGEKFNKSDFPIFKELYKQIGSVKKENDVYMEIKSDRELVKILQSLPQETEHLLKEIKNFYKDFFTKIFNNEFDLEKIYLPKSVGTHFSHLAFSDWSKLAFVFNKRWKNEKIKIKEGEEVNVQYRSLADIKKRMEEILKMDGSVSFGKIYQNKAGVGEKAKTVEDVWNSFWKIIQYHIESQFGGGEKEVFDKENKENKDEKTEKIKTIDELKEKYLQAVEEYKKKMVDTEEGLSDKEEKEIKASLKNYLDRLKDIERIGRYFDLRKYFEDIDEADKDGDFYFNYQNLLEDISEAGINERYNEIRNYLTKANIVDDKFKLNFNDGQTLSGWDLNKETEKFGLIFRRRTDNGIEYYLGIINKEKDKKIFNKKKHPEIFVENSEFEKMEYKLMKDAHLIIPKASTQLKSVKKHFKRSDSNYVLTSSSSLGNFRQPLTITKEIFELNNFEYKKDYLKKIGAGQEKFDLNNRVEAGSKKNSQIKLFQADFLKITGESEVYKEALKKWINFCKDFLKAYPSSAFFDFSILKATEEYKDLNDFYTDVNRSTYFIKFYPVNKDYIDQKIENGELYLFRIHNKDWNLANDKKKQSKKNLHTIYFEELFSDENIAEPVFKLSGGAEVFFRDAIEKKKQKKKKDKTGKEILDKPRFAQNKILFHVPITINYGRSSVKQNEFNEKINEFIANNAGNINILGIDRGEKHLLYYSLIDGNGNIIESGSLNAVDEYGNWVDPEILEEHEVENGFGEKEKRWKYIKNGKEIKATNYHAKLDELEKKRQKERQSWQKINQIKNLKAGYISQVIKKIVDLAIENNAIIVLEDLNFSFKSFRQKIEKNVYQQFEKALIDKLGFVVDKEKLNHRSALQLAAPFESFEKMGKQTGIVFYVLAANTSKVCPQCQWRKNIYPYYTDKESISKNLQKQYKMKMYWLGNENRFAFTYKGEGDKEFVKIYSDVDRIRYDKKANNNQGGYVIYQDGNKKQEKDGRNTKEKSITNLLKDLLLEKFQIDNLEGELLSKLAEKSSQVSKETIKDLFRLLNLILNIRNSMTDTREDYIQCPACGFDTREKNKIGIKNGDANGAYNIALRGRFLIDKIVKAKEEGKKPNLAFSNNDYFQWVREFVRQV